MPDFDELDAYFADFSVEMTMHGIGNDDVIDVLFSDQEIGVYRVKELNSPDPPFALAQDEDITELERDCQVTINGLRYNVLDIPRDGTGLTNIILERNNDAA